MKTKTIVVRTEQWFTNASFNEVKMLAIKHLGIPADRMDDSHKPENSKRALARQVFNKSHQYGEEFEIIEINPFGKVPKRRTSNAGSDLVGEYRYVKSGVRDVPDSPKHKMMEVISNHTTFESVLAAWDKEFGLKTKFKNAGKGSYDFIEMVKWALAHNWIVRV